MYAKGDRPRSRNEKVASSKENDLFCLPDARRVKLKGRDYVEVIGKEKIVRERLGESALAIYIIVAQPVIPCGSHDFSAVASSAHPSTLHISHNDCSYNMNPSIMGQDQYFTSMETGDAAVTKTMTGTLL